MTRILAFCFASVLPLTASVPVRAVADEDDKKAAALRSEILKADSSETMASAYKKLFTHLGLARLKTLVDDADTSIALQAAWEVRKKVVKREKPLANRTDWVFDESSIEDFLRFFTKRTGNEPPRWWRNSLVHGEVFPKQHHAFIELDRDRPVAPKFDTDKDPIVVTVGKESLTISKAAIAKEVDVQQAIDNQPTALLGKEQSFLASPPSIGYPFRLIAIDSKTSKLLWKAEVWASRRGPFGGRGYHVVEIKRHKDTVIVYGLESHGMYAEGFDARTGESQFRFCSCYWFNFSESWGLK